jgi:hypothetical protein
LRYLYMPRRKRQKKEFRKVITTPSSWAYIVQTALETQEIYSLGLLLC